MAGKLPDISSDNSVQYQKEQVLCEDIGLAVNGYFDFQKFAESMNRQHRTVLQLMFRLMLKSMLHMTSGAIGIDKRNQASFQLCSELADILEKHHLPLI